MKLENELLHSHEIVSKPALKDMSDVVARLQGDIDVKQQKIQTLKLAIASLKTQVLATSKELTEYKIKESLGPATNPDEILIQQKMANKISHLETINKR